MAKKQVQSSNINLKKAEKLATSLATSLELEFVDVVLQKESHGMCLLFFIDKEGGLSLNDCEKFHKAIIPLVEDMDYDFLEVSSPGLDRPIKTLRDVQKNKGLQVEVKLFAPINGSKLHCGLLLDKTDTDWIIEAENGTQLNFPLNKVALVKPVIDVDDADYSVLDQEITID